MNKVAFDKKQWDTFWMVWERKLETLPGAKKAALLKSGLAVQALLNKQIDSRFSSSISRKGKRFAPNEHVKRWQELRLGVGGGYAAISPKKVTVRVSKKSGRKYTAAAITRYLERGHKIREPSGRWKRYQPRENDELLIGGANGFIVPGRMFYSWTRMDSTRIAVNAARKEILEWIERFAEGEE